MDTPTQMKKWTVTAPDGTIYHGVLAPTLEDAIAKMRQGPQGPLAPPQRGTPRPKFSPSPYAGLPELARTAPALGLGPAGAAATLAAEGPSAQKPPVSGREILGDIVPLAVGALSPPGRTISRMAAPLLANILGRGAVEAGAEAVKPTGEGPLTAGVIGAAKGVLPGVVQSGLGALLGPTKDTLNTQRAIKALKGSVSKEVGAFLDVENPAALLKRSTPRAMTKAAGANLDTMEASISKGLGTKKFSIISGNQVAPRTFDDVRAEIKQLREAGSQGYATPELRGKARDALKKAAVIEADLVRQMPPKLAQQYKEATARHAADMDAVRWVRALHKREALMGGVNPQDRPGIAAAELAVNKPHLGTAAVHGTIGGLEAATGRGFGAAYHLGRGAAALGKRNPLRPASKVSTTLPAITGALGGLGTAAGQTAIGPKAAEAATDNFGKGIVPRPVEPIPIINSREDLFKYLLDQYYKGSIKPPGSVQK